MSAPAAPTRRKRRCPAMRFRARWRLIVRGRWALPALFFGSIVESTVLPWPIEFPMLAYMLRGRAQTLAVTFVVTLGSVLGCFLAYWAGRAAYEGLEAFIAARPGLEAALLDAQGRIDQAGAPAVFLAMMAPVPVQIASFAAGVLQMNPLVFLVAVFAGRSVRYWAMGLLVFFFGEPIMAGWRRLPAMVRFAGASLMIIAFAAFFIWTIWAVFGGTLRTG